MALRGACPMNMRREKRSIDVSDAVLRDVARIENLWTDALDRSGGPFLFGQFSIADAMFAPVVNRLDVYLLTENQVARSYMAHMQSQPAWQEWETAGKAEPWIVEEDEA